MGCWLNGKVLGESRDTDFFLKSRRGARLDHVLGHCGAEDCYRSEGYGHRKNIRKVALKFENLHGNIQPQFKLVKSIASKYVNDVGCYMFCEQFYNSIQDFIVR